MDIQHLRYFVAVARHGKIQAAADELCVCRQAVSKMLVQMERELGHGLFIRTRNGIGLNEKAQKFLARAQALVEDFEALRTEMGESEEACTLRICFPFTTHHYFRRILEEYLAREKRGLVVETVNCLDEECHRLLESGAIDLGVSLRPFSGMTDEGKLIASSPIVIAMSEENPLAGRESLSQADLGGVPLIYYMNGYEALSWLSSEAPSPAYTVNDILLAFDLVIQNKGALPIPRLSILQPMQGVVFVPYCGPDDMDNFYCALSGQAMKDGRKHAEGLALRSALGERLGLR